MKNGLRQSRERLRNRRGVTMAELLIVVAIIAVLSGVSFVGVNRYQRSMGFLERDEIAKQLFIAAQNHLSAAKGEGYLGASGYGTAGTGSDEGNYYYVVTGGTVYGGGEDAFRLMLPLGSIDDTVRVGGSYLIRYNKDSGTVLDVFYCTWHAPLATFDHTVTVEEYTALLNIRGDKSRRQNYGGAIVGWYGGAEAIEQGAYLESPSIVIHNEEILWVEITDTVDNKDNDASLQLTVTGETSKAKAVCSLRGGTGSGARVVWNNAGSTSFRVVLDDITTSTFRFAELATGGFTVEGTFLPGENLIVEALAFNEDKLSNIAYSGSQTVNSLFSRVSGQRAYIANFRHFENLSEDVSALAATVTSAEQISDMVWNSAAASGTGKPTDFKHAVQYLWKNSFGETTTAAAIHVYAGSAQADDSLCPVSPERALTYDGKSHRVTGVTVSTAGEAGLFGELTGSAVSDLELIDFSVTGGNAGALAGSAANTAITNVVARNSGSGTAPTVTATGSAGGLIGSVSGGSVSYCAAALTVESGANAGGLIGTADSVTVTGCYAGGHTDQGEYYQHDSSGKRTAPIYNVTASDNAGGLIGDAGSAGITNSYSTCSVSGTAAAGGFVGTASGSITNCYCTGLVSGATEGAFAGSLSGSASVSGCQYFAIINEREDAAGGFTCLEAADDAEHGGITALDESAASYDSFVGETGTWDAADAYDPVLRDYYRNNSYPLRTVFQLPTKSKTTGQTAFAATHYGDWPAPEIFLINK